MKGILGMKPIWMGCLVFSMIFANITSTGFAKSTYFKGSDSVKARDGILSATIKRGKQVKGSENYTWRIKFSSMYKGYQAVESFNMYCNVILQEGDVKGYKTYVLRGQKGYILSGLSNETKETRFFDFSFPKSRYRQGTIKAEVISIVKLRGIKQVYRVTASTKSKNDYA